MADPSLFGVGKAQWDLINGFANWFAAVGSFAAAFVALYIANRATKPSARVSAGVYQFVGGGYTKPYPEFIQFRIVNTGDRPIVVSQIGWKTGLRRKRFAIQNFDPSVGGSPLPVTLTHGQEATWFVPLDAKAGKEPWVEYFVKGLLSDHPLIAILTLRGQFFASTGHTFQVKPDESLLKRLHDARKKVHGKGDEK